MRSRIFFEFFWGGAFGGGGGGLSANGLNPRLGYGYPPTPTTTTTQTTPDPLGKRTTVRGPSRHFLVFETAGHRHLDERQPGKLARRAEKTRA